LLEVLELLLLAVHEVVQDVVPPESLAMLGPQHLVQGRQ
jgi:hypothetical protein